MAVRGLGKSRGGHWKDLVVDRELGVVLAEQLQLNTS